MVGAKINAQMKCNLRNNFQQMEDQCRENGQGSFRGHSDDSAGKRCGHWCRVWFKVFIIETIPITVV